MKKLFFLSLSILILAFNAGSAKAATAEQITSYDVAVKLNQDSSLNVTEKILYNFADNHKHGIFRTIPLAGANIFDIKVTDQTGQPYQFSATRSAKALNIKVGDPNKLITGEHLYNITYTVREAIKFGQNSDVLIWNAIGTDWTVPILAMNVSLELPVSLDKSQFALGCSYGQAGSSAICPWPATLTSGTKINIASYTENSTSQFVGNGNGVTFSIQLPKGILMKPGIWQQFTDRLHDFGGPLILLLAGILALIRMWFKFGRDPLHGKTIVPEYAAADNLTPAEIGTIFDAKTDNSDISAELIYLAQQGYLKINRVEHEKFLLKTHGYQLQKLKEPDSGLSVADFNLLKNIFQYGDTIEIADMKKSFPNYAKQFKEHTYRTLFEKGYFTSNPDTIRQILTVIGALLLVMPIFAVHTEFIYYAIAAAVLGLCVYILIPFIHRWSMQGGAAKHKIAGLKLYMNLAEKDRLEFHNAPEKNPAQFEKLLPYAIALGVETKWAEQFEGIYSSKPAWYGDSRYVVLAPNNLTGALRDFSNTSAANMLSSSGSGGSFGGSVGGGFGGGGGGSW